MASSNFEITACEKPNKDIPKEQIKTDYECKRSQVEVIEIEAGKEILLDCSVS